MRSGAHANILGNNSEKIKVYCQVHRRIQWIQAKIPYFDNNYAICSLLLRKLEVIQMNITSQNNQTPRINHSARRIIETCRVMVHPTSAILMIHIQSDRNSIQKKKESDLEAEASDYRTSKIHNIKLK